MIIALTMNPSIDISYPIKKLIIDSVNRVDNVKKTAGGKGLNVARVVKMADQPILATGLLGGNLGKYIQNDLDHDNIPHNFLPIAQESRNCIAILHEGAQTEILESGPTISEQEQLTFKQHFTDLITQADVITISGSLPKGMPANYYGKLIEIANQQHKKILLDCSGESLKLALSNNDKPYLIKPNHEELSFLANTAIEATDFNKIADVLSNHTELKGIPIIVVSLGKHGAMAKCAEQIWRITIPKINVVNPVGSGDSTLAGLAIGILKQESYENILKRAMVFGMLNAMEAQTGCINLAYYDELFKQIHVNLYQ
ncbi:hexose kinase [Orbus mooreae]|uniref:hexose kinase n=1 Tax=Orbus mooreae TaxID=3074107 RepID=UPI00370D9426